MYYVKDVFCNVEFLGAKTLTNLVKDVEPDEEKGNKSFTQSI